MMSLQAMIAISVLLGIDLLALLAMAVYTCWYPRWTYSLDSFAMMRLGASSADRIPLLVGQNVSKTRVLDELPGWIGDETNPDEEEVGRSALGAKGKLRNRRRYRCYEGDHERQVIVGKSQAIRPQ